MKCAPLSIVSTAPSFSCSPSAVSTCCRLPGSNQMRLMFRHRRGWKRSSGTSCSSRASTTPFRRWWRKPAAQSSPRSSPPSIASTTISGKRHKGSHKGKRGARMWLERLSTMTAHRVTGMAVMVSRRTARDSNVPPFSALAVRLDRHPDCCPGALLLSQVIAQNGVTVSRSTLRPRMRGAARSCERCGEPTQLWRV